MLTIAQHRQYILIRIQTQRQVQISVRYLKYLRHKQQFSILQTIIQQSHRYRNIQHQATPHCIQH